VRSAFLERFQREAKAAAKMQHPAIVTIFDVGVDEDSGAPFMVLEYLPGESLADRLDRVRLPLARCVQIGLDLSSALSFAHRQRIVHRDVKPANVLHAGDNRWKLADFGIARLPDSDLTQVGIFMGTPGYSPPEAIREGRYTPQADVFAWGAVMYELMSGRIPYEGPDTKTTNSYVVQGNAPPPTRHDPSIPEPLASVAMTALQPSDTKRFKDASEAEQALREAWERCLTQGLVHPAVLAMDETPHDKAPVRMHEPRGQVRHYAPPPQTLPPVNVAAFSDTNETTAIDDKIPAKAAALKQQQALVVESSKPRRGEDDDPTTLMIREEQAAKAKAKGKDGTSRGMVPAGPTPGGLKIPLPPPDTIDEARDSTRDTNADERLSSPPVVGKSMRERNAPMPRALWIAIAVLLLVGVAAVGLYLGGLLKL
jgi:serine/threonine-protein kinase